MIMSSIASLGENELL